MINQIENIVLKELDKYKFNENIESGLKWDNISESCYTNFKDIIVKTIIQMVHEILDGNDWKIKAFEKNKKEKIFNAFMENSSFEVLLSKSDNTLKKVIVELNFTEDEKKKIAKTYIDSLLEGYYYLDICIFIDLDEINVNTISKVLSDEVYRLLSPEEIIEKFKDKIEEAINVIEGYNEDFE